MKHTFSVMSYARQCQHNKPDQVSVYVRITVDGERAEISTKTVVSKNLWSVGLGRVAGKSAESRRLNEGIIVFEHRIREIYNRFLEQGKIITAKGIKNELLGIDDKQRLLFKHFDETLSNMQARVNHGYSPGTIKNWKVTHGHLKEFLHESLGVNDICFRELKLEFITDFELFARTRWNCGNNAALKHIERIRKVVRSAMIHNWLIKDPFMGFEGRQAKSQRTFLTIQEVEAIKNKKFEIDRLDRVKDIFVFSCYTGLAFCDVEKLTNDNVMIGIDGKKWIYTRRQKTNEKSNVPLLPEALSILEKYKLNNNYAFQDRLLPTITNIKTNAYLKEIAAVCNIKKNLTFHMARHTFATTITLTNGVPIETVSKILGHKKITTTQIYAKVLENKVSEDMQTLEIKLNRREHEDR